MEFDFEHELVTLTLLIDLLFGNNLQSIRFVVRQINGLEALREAPTAQKLASHVPLLPCLVSQKLFLLTVLHLNYTSYKLVDT